MTAGTDTQHEHVAATLAQFRAAYLARDVDAMIALFADDAELVAAPGAFRGKAEVRRFLAWDAELSPSATADDVGVGACALGDRVAVWERQLHLTYEGVPYDEDVATVIELDHDGLICRYRSYYDKLAVIQQVAGGLPGVGGWFTKQIVDVVVAAGSQGLEA